MVQYLYSEKMRAALTMEHMHYTMQSTVWIVYKIQFKTKDLVEIKINK